MKAIKYIAAVAVVGLASCQNDDLDLVGYNSDPNAVQITATVGHTLTRSNPTEEIGSEKATQFKVGDKISVSTDDQSAVVYVLETDNSWKPVDPNAYLVWNKSEHTFTAHYPAGEYTGYEPTRVIQDSEEDIAKADYMSFSGEFSNTGSISFEMERRTARVVIDEAQFSWGNQYMEGTNAIYEVKGIKIHAGDANDISPYKVGRKYYALVNSCAEKADAPFITLRVGPKQGYSGKEEELIIRGIPELAANTSYTFHLTIGKDKAELGKVTLEDWITGDIIDNGQAVGDYTVVKRPDGGDSYHIYSVEGLLEVNKILTAPDVTEAMLRADITLYDDFTLPTPAAGESNWTAIGNDSYYFSGNFNGNGHTIRGLVVRSNPTAPAQGLIGFTNGNVSNLTLEGCTVIGNKWVGGIVGINYGYNIENCKVIATKDYPVWIESAGGLVGGITGRHFNGTILKSSLVCESGASITIKNTGQASNVGGIAGQNDSGAMNECRVINNGGTITITSVSDNVGGFVGQNYASEDAHSVDFCIRDCSVNGVTVTGVEYVGGFAGKNDYYAEIRGTNPVTNSAVTGKNGTTSITVGKNFSSYHNPAVTDSGNNKLTTN